MDQNSSETPPLECADTELSTFSPAQRTRGDVDTVQRSISEWFEPAEEAQLRAWRTLRERQRRYELEAEALWDDLKEALARAVCAHNARVTESPQIACAETVSGGFAVTRFAHPLALLDVAIDIESGMIACIYTLGSGSSSSCRERLNVLLIRGTDSQLFLTDSRGQRLAPEESVNEILELYVLHLHSLRAP